MLVPAAPSIHSYPPSRRPSPSASAASPPPHRAHARLHCAAPSIQTYPSPQRPTSRPVATGWMRTLMPAPSRSAGDKWWEFGGFFFSFFFFFLYFFLYLEYHRREASA